MAASRIRLPRMLTTRGQLGRCRAQTHPTAGVRIVFLAASPLGVMPWSSGGRGTAGLPRWHAKYLRRGSCVVTAVARAERRGLVWAEHHYVPGRRLTRSGGGHRPRAGRATRGARPDQRQGCTGMRATMMVSRKRGSRAT